MKSIFVSAGEASGEHYGALILEALRRQTEASGQVVTCFGMGGARMRDAGLECVVRAEEMAVMGLTEVLRHLPHIYRELEKLKAEIRRRRPAVAILIDFPDLHFRLARLLTELKIPVVFFVSPQLWAWKQHRIELVRKYVTRMLCIFPFEEPYYRERGVAAEFVGHPLAELPRTTVDRAEFAREYHLHADATWIGLLPGSRRKEIAEHLPELIEAAWEYIEQHPEEQDRMQFLVPLAPTLNGEQRKRVLDIVEERAAGLQIRLVNDARATLQHARASIVASGTATIEAALIGNPFLVIYRVSAVTYAMAKRMVKVEHVAMANLIAGRRIVPELLQDDFTARNIVQHLEPLLSDGPQRASMMKELQLVEAQLHAVRPPGPTGLPASIERVAEVALELA